MPLKCGGICSGFQSVYFQEGISGWISANSHELYRFERWRSCAVHLWKVHAVDAGLLSCPVCQTYKTVTAVKLENHIKIHGEVRAYTCPDCGKGFKQASQLRNHRVMHLDRRAGPVPRW
jgi:hypothetical protein